MKKYSYFQAPVLSFYSKEFYKYIANEKSGTGFGYLLLLLALCAMPVTLEMENGFSNYIDNEASKLVSQVPVITIVNGEASIEEPQPYVITDPESGKPLIVIDTTGQVTSLQDTEAKILISKTFFLYEKDEFETRKYDLTDVQDYVLNQSKINSWLAIAKEYFFVCLYPAVLIGTYLWRIIQLLIYAVIGLIFVSLLNSSNSYGSLLRLSVIAITPVILMDTIFVTMMGMEIPYPGTLSFLAAMAYLFFGVNCSKNMETSR